MVNRYLGVQVHVICSMIAGFVAALASSPVDVIKSRLMNQEFVDGRGTKYLGIFDCLRKTVRAEGVFGLYKVCMLDYVFKTFNQIIIF
ncbi:hypothetical protein HK098_005951 [Nowakowskiella sp. JEL0407]|nr:hypothetical protein HK098_005951 [Nowakowskiella sp. JEL0407]